MISVFASILIMLLQTAPESATSDLVLVLRNPSALSVLIRKAEYDRMAAIKAPDQVQSQITVDEVRRSANDLLLDLKRLNATATLVDSTAQPARASVTLPAPASATSPRQHQPVQP